MSIALGITAPLSYSVFTALGAALLLGAVAMPHAVRSSARTHSEAELTSGALGSVSTTQHGGATGASRHYQ